MTRFSKRAFEPLDQEEEELMDAIEKSEWQSVPDFEQEKAKAVAAAKNALKKDKRVSVQLSEKDYHQIQIRAIEEGIPYRTLIASIIHKYLKGTLVPKA